MEEGLGGVVAEEGGGGNGMMQPVKGSVSGYMRTSNVRYRHESKTKRGEDTA